MSILKAVLNVRFHIHCRIVRMDPAWMATPMALQVIHIKNPLGRFRAVHDLDRSENCVTGYGHGTRET